MPTKLSPRRHPVRLLLDHLAHGGDLTVEDLAELPLNDEAPRDQIETAIREAAVEISTARAAGNRGDAREIARTVGEQLIELAGAGLPSRSTTTSTDPAELARLIPRGTV